MRLYLVQHGDAVAAEVNPQRPLSSTGERDVEALGGILREAGVSVERVLHSGKGRARQTAEALARLLSTHTPPATRSGLAPRDRVSAIVAGIAEWAGDSLLVGHQPFLGRLGSALLTGREKGMHLGFVPGAAVCVTRDEHGHWTLSWMLTPGLMRAPMRGMAGTVLGG